MKYEYFKNSIISFLLILSFVFVPLSLIPKKTEAANLNTILGGNGISSLITQMPLCQDIGSVKELFTQGNDLFEKALNDQIAPKLNNIVEDAVDEVDSVKVDIGTQPKEDIAKNAAASEKSAKDLKTLKKNDTCLKSIGRTIIKMLLQKITTDTVSWINGGMEGDPLFIENPDEYFGDIAKYEILGFGAEIRDPKLYPFGKEFMQAQMYSFKNKFANNAQYTLDKTIRDTNPEFSAYTFSQDFSQGGWAAWDALTQNAANNPLGFSIMASDELAKRIEEKTKFAEGSLQMSGGYFGVEKCVLSEPEGVKVSKQQDQDGRKERASNANGPYQNPICLKWNFVTPGQMVATAAEKITHYPDNNLLKSEDLNDAVAAILDAFLNHYSSSFMSEGGFAGLSEEENFMSGSEGEYVIDDENKSNYSQPRVSYDFSSFQIKSSSFLSENPNFNIRNDISQALIDEQRIFIDKIIQQNKELKSTVPKIPNEPEFTGNYGLIPTIYQLDYCIPGPHPGFENESRAALNAALNTITPETLESIKSKDMETILSAVNTILPLAAAATGAIIGASVGSGLPVVGTIIGAAIGAIVGILVALIQDWVNSSEEKKLRAYYAINVKALTGLNLRWQKDTNQTLSSKDKMDYVFNVILDRYIQIIYYLFDKNKMPSVTEEAAQKFLKAKGYNQLFTNNEDRIVSMQSVVKRLTEIKIKIEELNKDLENKAVKDLSGNVATNQSEQYDENLKPWISAFGRISQEMVTGDNIAMIDNLTKQIIDEKEYIYKDLLKGPNGCEKDLELMKGLNGPGLPWQIYATKRMEYPGPILYDYNNFKNSAVLPDPYDSKYVNKMVGDWGDTKKTPIPLNIKGPGFLSYIQFTSGNSYNGNGASDNVKECGNDGFNNPKCKLGVWDILAVIDNFYTYVGMSNPKNPEKDGEMFNGYFEVTAGVY